MRLLNVKNRRCSNEVPVQMMLGCEQPVGFSFEIKGCVGTASVAVEEERNVQGDVILLRFEGGSKVK